MRVIPAAVARVVQPSPESEVDEAAADEA
jgi:hypothetical protein